MLRNYLAVALRNLAANKLQSTINLGGLAVGLAACLLILIYVRHELSYERWLPRAERIASVESTFYPPGREPLTFAGSPGQLKVALEADFASDVERVVRVYQEELPTRVGDRRLVTDVAYVDPGFFDVFDLPMVAGDRAAALADTGSVLVTARTARKLFGDAPAIGQPITIGEHTELTVVGVLADLPRTTHLGFEAVARLEPANFRDRPWVLEQWTSVNTKTYVLGRTAAAIGRIEAGLPASLDRHARIDIPGMTDPPSRLMRLELRPLLDIHLHADKPGYERTGSMTTVAAFAGIALLILVIAGINFVNLATARAMSRAREVALRKVVGATRRQLVVQHLGEAALTALVALVLALALVELALPAFNQFLDLDLRLALFGDPALAATALGLVVAVGVLGGLYPALYLSRFRPATVLKANRSSAHGASWVRTGLVVFQFAISIALMAATATIYLQTRFARTMDLGFDHAGRAVLNGLDDVPTDEARQTLKREVQALPGVRGASLSSDAPPLRSNNNALLYPGPTVGEDKLLVEQLHVDADFFAVYGVAPVAGRLFDAARAGDQVPDRAAKDPDPRQGAVVNLAMVAKLGLGSPADAIGKVLYEADLDGGPFTATTIIGVVADLHLRSLRELVTPMFYKLGRPTYTWSRLSIDIAPGRAREVMAGVEAVWRRVVPSVPIRSSFVDADLAAQYREDRTRGQIFAGFAVFAVAIACLGLFGLAAFAAERRTKEIGMRKVLGASVGDIVRLLVWQFSRPVLLANLIAWPVAFWAMRRWLRGFRYAISLTEPANLIGIFGGAAAIAVAVAWLTTAGHAYRVARANPGKALRVE